MREAGRGTGASGNMNMFVLAEIEQDLHVYVHPFIKGKKSLRAFARNPYSGSLEGMRFGRRGKTAPLLMQGCLPLGQVLLLRPEAMQERAELSCQQIIFYLSHLTEDK